MKDDGRPAVPMDISKKTNLCCLVGTYVILYSYTLHAYSNNISTFVVIIIYYGRRRIDVYVYNIIIRTNRSPDGWQVSFATVAARRVGFLRDGAKD